MISVKEPAVPWDALSSASTKDAANSSSEHACQTPGSRPDVGAPVFASTQMFGDGGTRPISRKASKRFGQSSLTIDETAFAMASPCAGVSRVTKPKSNKTKRSSGS